jgi:DNA-binding beta-propeller fold protein YncE
VFALLTPVVAGILVALARPAAPAIRSAVLAGAPQDVALDPGTGRAFVLDDDASVQVVDLARARVVRTLTGGGAGTGVPVTMALDTRTQRLFVADPRDGLRPSVVRVLDSRTGATRGTTRVGRMACALAVDTRSGHVFVADEYDSAVSMLDARSGALLRTIRMGAAPVAFAVDSPAGRVFVLQWIMQQGAVSARSRVTTVDARSGVLLRTVAVGTGQGALAADVRSGRVFVTNGSDGTLSVWE